VKRAVIVACITRLFCQPAQAEEWFEKRDATKCTGTVQACMHELEQHGWQFAGSTDKNQSRTERRPEIWAKGRQMIVCQWNKAGPHDVTCELTLFEE
jgi:hypothetical protein